MGPKDLKKQPKKKTAMNLIKTVRLKKKKKLIRSSRFAVLHNSSVSGVYELCTNSTLPYYLKQSKR